ncbi:hypothetical protein B0H13DRAFT_1905769 [Mycena leptocephala]|nr:hypothetical protein B0H13DRAFT_1905769 [Mycena leptocephala]
MAYISLLFLTHRNTEDPEPTPEYPLGAEPIQDGDASDLEADHNSAFGEVPDPTYISAHMTFAGSRPDCRETGHIFRKPSAGAYWLSFLFSAPSASAAEDGAEPSAQEESTVATASAPTVPIVLGHGSQGLKTVPLPVGKPTPFELSGFILGSDIEDKELPENSLVVAHVTLVIEDELTSDTYKLAADSYGGITIILFSTLLGVGGGFVQWLPVSVPGTGKQVRVQHGFGSLRVRFMKKRIPGGINETPTFHFRSILRQTRYILFKPGTFAAFGGNHGTFPLP